MAACMHATAGATSPRAWFRPPYPRPSLTTPLQHPRRGCRWVGGEVLKAGLLGSPRLQPPAPAVEQQGVASDAAGPTWLVKAPTGRILRPTVSTRSGTHIIIRANTCQRETMGYLWWQKSEQCCKYRATQTTLPFQSSSPSQPRLETTARPPPKSICACHPTPGDD